MHAEKPNLTSLEKKADLATMINGLVLVLFFKDSAVLWFRL